MQKVINFLKGAWQPLMILAFTAGLATHLAVLCLGVVMIMAMMRLPLTDFIPMLALGAMFGAIYSLGRTAGKIVSDKLLPSEDIEEEDDMINHELDNHPDDYDGPCGCRECLSYSDGEK